MLIIFYLIQSVAQTPPAKMNGATDYYGIAGLVVSLVLGALVFYNQFRQNTIQNRVSKHDRTIKVWKEYAEKMEHYEKGFRILYRVIAQHDLLEEPDIRKLDGLIEEMGAKVKKKDDAV